ncbi:MAG: HAMP domain-containing sensor histidine kinase, partial [Bacteroidota bacterium]|nr:HAMP domain-containing sensor histidine kinase [Bacteroidota bacterium]
CLLFLLKIINRQKQLAEVKNDLISNITHEFKTPIATISVALEGIKNFNRENDPVKTGNYVNTSTAQLDKLTMMVEKLLETATLDGDDLALNKEEVNLNNLLQSLVNKHQTLAIRKKISFSQTDDDVIMNGDPFHLENAFNNLLDNAVKYGGETILVELENRSSQIEIQITDSGTSLSKAEAKQIFEKFYRVPKGNTHDVKGFGIGLYYTQKIIEKHGGSIDVSVTSQTTFKIDLPNA